jgi:hypothetical protein
MSRYARFVADRPHPLTGDHLAQVRQVGEGVSPSLDA